MAETKFGTFDELLEITAPEMQPIVQELRQIVTGVDPDAVEVVRLGDRAATYGVGPKKMSEAYVYILPHNIWASLKGQTFPMPVASWKGRARTCATSRSAP
jgi:hypothetical protein